jgi:hypothetical protein
VATISTPADRCWLENGEVERYLRRRRVLLGDDASVRVLCSLNLREAKFEVSANARKPQPSRVATASPGPRRSGRADPPT